MDPNPNPNPEYPWKTSDLEPGSLANPKQFGLLNLTDNTWVGTDEGPLTYGDRKIAQIAAQALCERMELPMGRIEVEPFSGANVKAGEMIPRMSGEEAMRRISGEEK